MWLIVGLGNPGEEYAGTRHNAGFLVVDEIARRLGVAFRENRSNALIADAHLDDDRMLLVKPQSFMNVSGASVRTVRDWFDIAAGRMLIVHDDMDVPFGEVRLKENGGSAGHKGVQSVIDELGDLDFKRLRVGIGHPPGKKDPSDYVLEPFSPKEQEELAFIIQEAADIAVKLATNLA